MGKPIPKTPGSLPEIGDIVAGKYRVEGILGSGGMGVVLSARHQQLGELVAIKLLTPGSDLDGNAIARLMREARATASIKSEHVVRVLDVGSLPSGSPYILMEFLSGTDLSELVRGQGPLPVALAVHYVLQACEAIAEAHARGIIHRDLKPSNLFLTRRADGSPLVKVLDFGVAKAALGMDSGADGSGPNVSLTATRAVVGSPAYMSPEQVRSSKRVDERTDVWALGVILYELLTGLTPFTGETMSGVLAAIVADAPTPLRAARPDAPEGLERVVAACLVKDVGGRTQTVAELAKALEPFAPPGSEPGVQRVVRLGAGGFGSLPPPPTSPSGAELPGLADTQVGLLTTVKAVTTSTMQTPAVPRWRAGRLPGVLAGGAAALAFVVAVVVFARGPSSPPAAASAPAATSPPASAPPAAVATTERASPAPVPAAQAPDAATPAESPRVPGPAQPADRTAPRPRGVPSAARPAAGAPAASTPAVVEDRALDGR